MSQVGSTSAASTTGLTPTPSSIPNKAGTNLGENDFLKLMMVQLQHQDPLQPSDPTQYLSELAQFTSVEQITNMAASSSKVAASQQSSSALALLGHQVSYSDSNGNARSGTVQKVEFGSSGPTLTIDGVAGIDPTTVSEVS
jgi:flagellar basal-body rod modification protein FlgD